MLRKPTILVFCELEVEAARKYAATIRNGTNLVFVRAALQHTPYDEREECTKVIIMPDVTVKARAEVKRIYPVVEEVHRVVPPPPVNRRKSKKEVDSYG